MTASYTGISVFSGQPICITCDRGSISEVAQAAAVPGLPYISPGFLDIQVNGYRGIHYNQPGLAEDHVRAIVDRVAPSGTAQHVATVVTAPFELMLRNCEAIARAREDDADTRAAIAGIHIEGPYISPKDGPRGAHDQAAVRAPDVEEFSQWQEAARGAIRMITVAPESDGAIDFIGQVAATGVVVSIGHTAADSATIQEAIRAGARLSTHLGNGSHASLPRLHNYIWEQLGADELRATIIADGFHLPFAVLKVVARTKGLDRLILISDVVQHGGQPPGVYTMGSMQVEVHDDGHIGLAGTPFLAGAGHLLDRGVARFMSATGADLASTVRLCTTNPARLLGLPPRAGTLQVGAPANLTIFRYRDGDDCCAVEKTVREGCAVYVR